MKRDYGEDVRPDHDKNGLPVCVYEHCPSYDGKRCKAMGFRPDRFCGPALISILEASPPTPNREAARAAIHEAMRRADKRGCANLPACAFGDGTETMLCDELVAAFEASPTPSTSGDVGVLVGALGFDTPWPVNDVLTKLAAAAWHMLAEHGCDQHGHEEVAAAVGAAQRIVKALAAWRTSKPGAGT